MRKKQGQDLHFRLQREAKENTHSILGVRSEEGDEGLGEACNKTEEPEEGRTLGWRGSVVLNESWFGELSWYNLSDYKVFLL